MSLIIHNKLVFYESDNDSFMIYVANKPLPAHRRCRRVQSSGPEQAPQEEQGNPGPSGLPAATGQVPSTSY